MGFIGGKKEHATGKSKTRVFLILGWTENEADAESSGGGGVRGPRAAGQRRMKKFLSD